MTIGCLLIFFCPLVQAELSRDDLMEQAQALRMERRPSQAKALYDRILLLNDEDADALVGRGYCQIQTKEFKDALSDFEHAIVLAPTYVDAYAGKAIVLKRQGKWGQAKAALVEGRKQLEGDQKALNYLAEHAWREGFYALARSLDKSYPPEIKRQLMDYENEVTLSYGYDWLDNREDWWEMNLAYNHWFRPDQSVSLYYSDFRRDTDNDFLAGLGYAYKWNYLTSFSYDVLFSDGSGFVAKQKHRPRVYFKLPYGFAVGAGGNFDKFADEWAKVSHTEILKYFGNKYLKYTILAGDDNFDQRVVTHIGEAGYEKDSEYNIRMGYATGNESLERADRVINASIVIDSYFVSGKYFVTPEWGVNVSVIREYRGDVYFRTTGSTGIFYRF